jgi:serine/threonine protein kinase
MTPEGYEEERSAASMGEMQREDLLAPEIFTGHKPDVQTDIYSLGATLAYLLVGVPMRLDKSLEKAAGTVPNIKEYVRNTPIAVQKVFKRMVAKDRAARYKDYAQVIDMLQATLDPVRHPEIEAVEAAWGKSATKVAASTVKSALNSQLLWVGIALAAVIGLAFLVLR